MSIYDINGNVISSGGSDSYFEVISEMTGNKLQPKSEYQSGFYRGMTLNTHFKTYFGENYTQFANELGVRQTKGKSLYVGGDSLHAYSGGDGKSTSGFITEFNKYLGFTTVKNDGYAGSTWTGTDGGGAIKRVTDLVANTTPYDVFILAWGTNDDPSNGTIDDEVNNDGSSMVGAMKWCINQLRTTFKYSAIGIIIPPPKNTNDGMKEKGDLMTQVCEQMHVPYADMRKYLSIDDMSSDGVHLGYGENKYGAVEAKLILDICPYGEPLL